MMNQMAQMAQLTKAERMVVDSYCEAPCSFDELATRFGVTRKTAKNQLTAARRKLGYAEQGLPTAAMVADWWRERRGEA